MIGAIKSTSSAVSHGAGYIEDIIVHERKRTAIENYTEIKQLASENSENLAEINELFKSMGLPTLPDPKKK